MLRRIFIAINLPEKVRDEFFFFRDKWPELPARWTKKENLHITLSFLGQVSDEELVEVCQKTKEVALEKKPFQINLNKIIYGPPARNAFGIADASGVGKNPPRMVWATGEESQELGNLQRELENAFSGKTQSEKNNSKPYAPHITLARLKQWEFQKMESEEMPEINEKTNLTFEVNSIEVMESDLKKNGPEYEIIESFQLGGGNSEE